MLSGTNAMTRNDHSKRVAMVMRLCKRGFMRLPSRSSNARVAAMESGERDGARAEMNRRQTCVPSKIPDDYTLFVCSVHLMLGTPSRQKGYSRPRSEEHTSEL